MMKLIRTDRYKGFKFKNAFRFIDDDDTCTINDSDAFNESYQEIYPTELQLKCEHSGDHATFLELDITIVDGIFVYKLFDTCLGALHISRALPYLSFQEGAHAI